MQGSSRTRRCRLVAPACSGCTPPGGAPGCRHLLLSRCHEGFCPLHVAVVDLGKPNLPREEQATLSPAERLPTSPPLKQKTDPRGNPLHLPGGGAAVPRAVGSRVPRQGLSIAPRPPPAPAQPPLSPAGSRCQAAPLAAALLAPFGKALNKINGRVFITANWLLSGLSGSGARSCFGEAEGAEGPEAGDMGRGTARRSRRPRASGTCRVPPGLLGPGSWVTPGLR